MEIVRVQCLGKSLGISKGLRIDVLNDGESIGNILRVESFINDNEGVVLFSEMLGKIYANFRIIDLVKEIENGNIEII
jgi:hypothetical protein